MNELFEEAQKKLAGLSKDASKYETVFAGLIEEGLLALLEDKISLKVREADVAIAEKAIPVAAKNYEDKTKKTVTITVNNSDYLPKDAAGGVIIINSTGKIDVNNTFEERLKLLSESSLPAIRLTLFGPSASRKFFD